MKLSIVVPYRNRKKPDLIRALYSIGTAAKVCEQRTQVERKETGLDIRRNVEIIVASDEFDFALPYLLQDTVDGDTGVKYVNLQASHGLALSLCDCYWHASRESTGRYILYTSGRDALYPSAIHSVFEALEYFEVGEPWPDALVFRSIALHGMKYRKIPEPHLRYTEEIEDHEMAPLCLLMARPVAQRMDWMDHEVDNSGSPAYAMLRKLISAEKSTYLSKRCLGWSL